MHAPPPQVVPTPQLRLSPVPGSSGHGSTQTPYWQSSPTPQVCAPHWPPTTVPPAQSYPSGGGISTPQVSGTHTPARQVKLVGQTPPAIEPSQSLSWSSQYSIALGRT